MVPSRALSRLSVIGLTSPFTIRNATQRNILISYSENRNNKISTATPLSLAFGELNVALLFSFILYKKRNPLKCWWKSLENAAIQIIYHMYSRVMKKKILFNFLKMNLVPVYAKQ